MEAVRQIHKVQNGAITVHLPADFPTDEVEVIVLPVQHMQNGLYHDAESTSQSDYDVAVQRFLMMDTAHFTEVQMAAYARTCGLLQRGRVPGEPPVFGIFEGLIEIADDFDAPLSDDILDLFYGSETDEYGLSLP